MRSLVIALGLLVVTAAIADAKPRSKATAAPHKSKKRGKTSGDKKRTAAKRSAGAAKRETKSKRESRHDKRKAKSKREARVDKRKAKSTRGTKRKRVGHALKRHRRFEMPRGPISGQSLGAPWSGRLRNAAELQQGPGFYIRRPWRAFGTTTMVEILERVVVDVADRYYDTHPIAIGDLSAEQGGHISDHSSHQSGRDVDVGLIFTQKPAAYPSSFVVGNGENLDLEATFVLVEEFAKTVTEPGGVQIIFLDFAVQGLLYDWALENGEDAGYLARLFQYPHGRGASIGVVRHEPNHADHLHVRFQCPPADSICR